MRRDGQTMTTEVRFDEMQIFEKSQNISQNKNKNAPAAWNWKSYASRPA
jgi:hypothetical protein